jgi:hypothetical protein
MPYLNLSELNKMEPRILTLICKGLVVLEKIKVTKIVSVAEAGEAVRNVAEDLKQVISKLRVYPLTINR